MSVCRGSPGGRAALLPRWEAQERAPGKVSGAVQPPAADVGNRASAVSGGEALGRSHRDVTAPGSEVGHTHPPGEPPRSWRTGLREDRPCGCAGSGPGCEGHSARVRGRRAVHFSWFGRRGVCRELMFPLRPPSQNRDGDTAERKQTQPHIFSDETRCPRDSPGPTHRRPRWRLSSSRLGTEPP